MISWMQKHKKYLVITIWISTIAFVGAGFVGWGAYKYGSREDVMAEVGKVAITIKEFQNRFSQIYNSYNQLLGNKLDQQKAKEMGLDKMAFNELIKEALLENYAKDMGLIVTDEEVAKKIESMQVFWQNGKFDKNLYINVLKQNHMRPKDFEESLKKELLLQKLQAALAPTLYPIEFDTIASALFIGDKIEYKILSSDDLKISYDKKALQQYFNEHKENYKTPAKYIISLIEISPSTLPIDQKRLQEFYQQNRIHYKDSEGKILPFEKAQEQLKKDLALKLAKKEALKKYIAFKKGKIKASKQLTITQNDSTLPQKLLTQLKLAQEKKTFKPFLHNNHYLIVRLEKKILPQPMDFEEAKELVQKDFEKELKAQELIKVAKKESKSFQGKRTKGYICRDDIDKLPPLQPQEAAKFLKELFIQKDSQGYIALSDQKVVLFKILDQKLKMPHKIDKNRQLISENSLKLKEILQNQHLLQKLQKVYNIVIYKGL